MSELKEPVTHYQPHRVSVKVSYLRNMGNFENLNLEVGVEDSKRGDEKVDDTFERVFGYVSKKLIEKLNEVEDDLEKRDAAVDTKKKNGK